MFFFIFSLSLGLIFSFDLYKLDELSGPQRLGYHSIGKNKYFDRPAIKDKISKFVLSDTGEPPADLAKCFQQDWRCHDLGYVKFVNFKIDEIFVAEELPHVYLTVTFGTKRVGMLHHFVEYYREAGVSLSRFLVILNAESETDANLRVMSEYLTTRQIGHVLWIGEFSAFANHFHGLHLTRPIDPKHWIVWADSDELQRYDADVYDLVRRMSASHCNAMYGWLVDRVSPDGSLPDIKREPSIAEQFPHVCNVTLALIRGTLGKVLMAQASLRPGPGHHVIPNYRWFYEQGMAYLYNDNQNITWAHRRPVYHYKWVAGATEYMRQRAQSFREQGIEWWRESQNFVDAMDRTGRIDVEKYCSDPNFDTNQPRKWKLPETG